MGRLDDIIERNKHPRRYRKMKFPYGIALSVFVLIILVLAMFTDLGMTKQPRAPTRIDGVQLRKVPLSRGPEAVPGSAASQPR